MDLRSAVHDPRRPAAQPVDHRGGRLVRARLVDVLGLTFLALASVKAVDVASDHGAGWAVGWVAVCALSVRCRAGYAALAVAAFVGWALADQNMQSTHAILIAWVALIFAVSEGQTRIDLLRTQAVAVYLFAALNKLNPEFLRGDAIATRVDELPFGVPLSLAALGAVLVEAWLAWAVWTRSRFALPVAIGLHASIVVFMGTGPYEWTMLAAYNGLMVLLVWAAQGGNREPSPSISAA